MASFPTLSTGSVALFPLGQEDSQPVRIARFVDGSEQRWVAGKILRAFTLTLDGVSYADAEEVSAFFAARSGAFVEWDITIGGVFYDHMRFESSSLTMTNSTTGFYSLSCRARQWRQT